MIQGPKAFRSGTGEIFTPYVQQSIAGSSRLEELKGRTEVMPSLVARGYWKLGVIGCRGASWSEQLDGKEHRGALGSAIGTEKIPVFWTRLQLLHCGMLNL